MGDAKNGSASEGLQAFQISVPHRAAKAETHPAPFADNVDQTRFGEFLQVMRDSGGGNVSVFSERAAGHRVAAGDLLKDGEAARVRESASNSCRLLRRKGRRHDLIVVNLR